LTSQIEKSSIGSYYTYTNEYYLDKKNTLGNESRGSSFLGKSDKNLIKKQTIAYTSNSLTDTYIFDFTYEFDKNDNVTKKISTDKYGTTYWDSYTYK
jgi:hypothetical protein